MQLKHFTLCAVSLAASAGAVQAQPFTQADSLKDLPASLQKVLGAGGGDNAIADRGERFNAGCVGEKNVPHKRFLIGAVSADLVVVAIEVGGYAHYSQTLQFRRMGENWIRSETKNAVGFPKSMQELLQGDAKPALAAAL